MIRLMIPVLTVVTLSACVADLGEGRVEATVEDPAPAKAAPAVSASAKTLAIDPQRSKLHALGAKITATHDVDFPVWRGEVKVDGDAVVGMSFEADMASLVADHPKLTTHLKDADFFDVGAFPKASFVATSVTEGAEGGTHTVTGDLTVKGQTKTVRFPAKVTVADDVVQAETEFVIDRQDFGVTYRGRPDDLVQDKVVLTVSWVAPRG